MVTSCFLLLFFQICKVNSYTIISFILSAGTERCNEALLKLGKHYDVVVNIQGDEPLIEPDIIDGIVRALQVVTCTFIAEFLLFIYVYMLC